ncbi:MAG TPA: DUF2000 family protein [Rhizomicrobium sp.]
MRFDTKIVVVLRDNLAAWQRANVTAFLVNGIAAEPGVVGEPYMDAAGNKYLPMLRQPVFVFQGTAAEMQRTYERARSRDIAFSIFPDDIFVTNNDDDNRAATAKLAPESMNLAGLAFRADAKIADKISGGLARHS